MATHSSILAWRVPQTEEPVGLQSIRLQRVGHSWVTNTWSWAEANATQLPRLIIGGVRGKGRWVLERQPQGFPKLSGHLCCSELIGSHLLSCLNWPPLCSSILPAQFLSLLWSLLWLFHFPLTRLPLNSFTRMFSTTYTQKKKTYSLINSYIEIY